MFSCSQGSGARCVLNSHRCPYELGHKANPCDFNVHSSCAVLSLPSDERFSIFAKASEKRRHL